MKRPIIKNIYLDHNATTALDPAAFEAMLPFLKEGFGNPSSVHRIGQEALQALDTARLQVADFIGAVPDLMVMIKSPGKSKCRT